MPQEQTNSVDHLMLNVASMLVRDFRTCLSDPGFFLDFDTCIKRQDLPGFRSACSGPTENMDVPTFKAVHQMSSLFKRYRFDTDLFSDDELVAKAIASFHMTQTRIRAINLDSLGLESQRVLNLARIYIADTLGVYDDEEHRSLCKFGRRASVGIPAKKACEGARWELPVTGSQNQIDWFDSEMSQIESVQNYWTAQKGSDPEGSTYQSIDSLALTLVPKTFKSFRSIMPNSTIGSYMSYGLGVMMTDRLKRKGYDISSLQERHKYLARRGSEHQCFTTADLSSASDSISVALVDRLFPKDWCDVLHRSRIGRIRLPDGTYVESETFCTMGIGYTFPLQTLVFLSLLKAILFLVHGRRMRATISVYGDDMIYISSIHPTVVRVFEEIGFVINLDKTFHEGGFRESCGGDYYRGVDVRPFCPKNGSANVGRKTYEAILYKLINGLLMRWSEYEVSGTLNYLLSEVEGRARIVPADFPDDSGIKCSLPVSYAFLRERSDVALPKFIGHGVYRFSYLSLVSETREEERHEPYYWLALRDGLDRLRDHGHHQDCVLPVDLVINEVCGITQYVPFLLWKEHITLTVRSDMTGCRLRRLLSYVTVSHTGKYKRQSGTSCFGVPQNRVVS